MKPWVIGLVVLVFIPLAAAGTCISSDLCENSANRITQAGIVDKLPLISPLQSWCESPLVSGTYSPQELSITDWNAQPQCAVGCCCSTVSSPTLGANSCGLNPFRLRPTDMTCLQVCNGVNTGEQQCTLDATATQNCQCGGNLLLAGGYCCWDGTIQQSANACTPPPSGGTCTTGPISQSCYCGNAVYTNGFCCNGLYSTVACDQIPPPSETCGNLIQEGTEACDASYTKNPATGAWQRKSGDGCPTPGDICTFDCRCIPSPKNQDVCGNGVCEIADNTCWPTATDCANPTMCNVIGATSLPQKVLAVYDESTKTVAISWEPPIACSNLISGYTVSRALSQSGVQLAPDFIEYIPNQNIPSYSFIDTYALPNVVQVWYGVTVQYSGMGGNSERTATTEVQIATVDCPQPDIKYCKQNPDVAVTCTGYQATSKLPCLPNQMCAMVSGNPTCINFVVNACSGCNGLFESFSDDSARILEGIDPVSGQGQNILCSNSLTCYKDLRDTSIPLYLSCSKLTSCAGYRTQQACQDNECTMPGGCVWSWVNQDLGVGVCGATEQSFLDCSNCNSNPSCNQQTCQAIGTQCYYKNVWPTQPQQTNPSVNECVDKSKVYCEWLPNQQECEGASTFQLDSQHNVITNSNDGPGHGKCRWFTAAEGVTTPACAKDSNANGIPDFQLFDPGVGDLPAIPPASMPSWLLDFTNPITIIDAAQNTAYPQMFRVPIRWESGARVYTCFAPTGQPCNTWTLANVVNIDPKTPTMGTLEHDFAGTPDGTAMTLHYYSQDASLNLEPVRTLSFVIDTTPLTITVDNFQQTMINTGSATTPIILTDATIDFTTSEIASCNLALQKGPTVGPAIFQNQWGTTFSDTETALTTETYQFIINCRDAAGNIAPTVYWPFTVENNAQIQMLLPFGVMSNSTLIISARTLSNTNCYFRAYDAATPRPPTNQMTRFSQTGNLLHQHQLFNVAPGFYDYIVACDFAGTTVYAQNHIRYTIDRDAPNAYFCDSQTILPNGTCTPLTSGGSYDTINIVGRCTDNPVSSQAFASNFGCACGSAYNISFCVHDTASTCTPSPLTTLCQPNRIVVVPPIGQPKGDYVIEYITADKGGFTRSGSLPITITDRTPPNPPLWSIDK